MQTLVLFIGFIVMSLILYGIGNELSGIRTEINKLTRPDDSEGHSDL